MRVAWSVAVGEARVEQRPDPEPEPGEVVCRVLACGVCASDVMEWYVRRKLPGVLGHEPAGEVVAVGAGVEAVRPGDRVAIHHHAPCGRCPTCRRGHETLCPAFRAGRLDPGGFAELVRIPAGLVGELLPLGPVDPVAATFTEPLACVVRSQERVALVPDDALLVVGAGSAGLLQVAAARARGVERIFVREPRPERRAQAVAWGAAPHGDEPVDVVMACTPADGALAAAAACLAPGGRLCVYAPPPPGTPLALDGCELFLREITVSASYSAGPADMRAALDLLATGAVDPGPLVSHEVGLEETGRALALARAGQALKAVVRP